MPGNSTFNPGASRSLTASVLLALLLTFCAGPTDAPVATIKVSSATAGSNLGGRLVEGLMSFRGNEYILTLRGVDESVRTMGSVRGLLRARAIEGVYEPTDQGLRNAAGVTIRFDPPLVLGQNKLEIELMSRRSPKVSTGHRESGVE